MNRLCCRVGSRTRCGTRSGPPYDLRVVSVTKVAAVSAEYAASPDDVRSRPKSLGSSPVDAGLVPAFTNKFLFPREQRINASVSVSVPIRQGPGEMSGPFSYILAIFETFGILSEQ